MHITLFHAHNNAIPYILQLYSMLITTLFHAYNNSIPYVLQLYPMHITTLFHTYYKSVPCTYSNSIPCCEVKKKRERGGGEGGRERNRSLFTRVIDSSLCMLFYVQLSPKQRIILDLIAHVHIFKDTTHRYNHGINEV